jgi:superfamily I DNA/RNA helicase
VAPPGTGKTTVAAEIINHTPTCTLVVALTFSRAAARELESRLTVPPPFVGTIHSWAMRIISKPGPQDWTIVPEVIDDLLKKDTAKTFKVSQKALDEALWTHPWADVPSKQERAAMAYEKRMLSIGFKSHDMVLRDAIVIGGKFPIQVDMLIVDEAQDLSNEDWSLIDAIQAKTRVYFGDPMQSIYQFREARPEMFESNAAMNTRMVLKQNFRSNPGVRRISMNLRHPRRDDLSKIVAEHVRFTPGLSVTSDWFESFGTHAILMRTNNEVATMCEWLESIGVKPTRNDLLRREIRTIGGLASCQSSPHPEARILLDLDDAQFSPEKCWDFATIMCSSMARLELKKFELIKHSPQWISDALEFDLPPDPTLHVGTIHSAKGGEWDHVWIDGADWLQRSTPEGCNELRQLMYVAVTRAKKTVTISGIDNGFGWWLVKEMGLA